jgi:hypothetical protein
MGQSEKTVATVYSIVLKPVLGADSERLRGRLGADHAGA